jgi:hypothetical protein
MTNQSTGSAPRAPFAGLSLSFENSLRSLPEISRRSLAQVRGVVSFVAALMLTGAVGAVAQAPILLPNWNQLSPASSPSQRSTPAIAYDATHGQIVMFGGYTGSYLNDTWVFNGTTWTDVTPADPAKSPSIRSNEQMVYDPATGNVVLFGGLAPAPGNPTGEVRLGDTWIWDGANWTQVIPVNSPTNGRASASMVYDAAAGNVVLFGGLDTNGMAQGDTWVWDGTNWTQKSPGSSPPARFAYGMDYDAATGQVVLFGGTNASNIDIGDTWTWDGTTWTQQSPPLSPGARDGVGMAYDPALSQVVLFGGESSEAGTAYFNDTWAWNGTSWIIVPPAVDPAARYAGNSITYDAALGQLILFGGTNFSNNTTYTDTWEFGLPQNFGNINVCPSGQTSPAPCSITLPLTLSFAQPSTILSINVVTQGAPSLDFTQANGGNCAGAITAGNTCTMDVTFTPLAPGLRTGAVQLSINSLGADQLTTIPIYGNGQGPEIAYGPAFSGTTILGGPSLENVLATPGFTPNPRGMATDAAGNLYISDPSHERLLMRTANGTTTTVGTLSSPQGVAIDGAGNLFVADTELREVVEIPAGCITVACQVPVYNPSSADPVAVVVDGQGDLFIADPSAGGVVEVPAGCASNSCWIPIGSGWHSVNTLAVDAAGDLFVPDSSAGFVSEMPAGCTTNSCRVPFGGGWIVPQGIAVDAAGDVYVSDTAAAGGMGQVTEVPAGCSSSTCEIALVTGIFAYDLAVDQLGQVYAVDGGQILQINQSQPPTESFATADVGTTSTDSPQSFTLLNVGNQTLKSVLPGFGATGPNFYQVSESPTDCSANFSLAPGAGCNVSLSFMPQVAGNLTGTATATDNNLNAASATQTFNLSGTAVGVATNSLSVNLLGSGSGTVTDGASLSCSATNLPGCSTTYPTSTLTVTLTETPTAGSAFIGWSGACAGAGTNPQCVVTMTAATNVTANFTQESAGPVDVCAAGVVTGCTGSTFPVTFNFPNGAAISQIQAVTQGATGLDFSAPNSGPCINAFTAGQSCTVNVTFTPTAPGLRMGAVELLDSGGNVLTTQLISGIGQGPEIAFSPGRQTTEPFTNPNYPVGVALDGAGNLYIANYGVIGGNAGYVVKITPGGVQTTVLSAYTSAPGQAPSPIGVAVDGAGNLFIADLYLSYAVKVTPSGVQTTVGSGLSFSTGIAVDGMGDVFIADQDNKRVVEVTPAGVQTTVPATGLQQPWGVATDAVGDVFIADGDQTQGLTPQVVKVTPSGAQSTIPTTGLSRPYHLAVDAAGDVIIDDSLNHRVVQVSPAGVQTTLVTGLGFPSGVTVDPAGDLFIGDQGNQQVYEINRSAGPTLTFANTNVGSSSGPDSVTIQNIGNQNLTGSASLTSTQNFSFDGTSNCGGIELLPGASCTEAFDFAPSTASILSTTAQISDNSLNAAPATQTVALSGVGVSVIPTTVAVPNVVALTQSVATTTITAAGLVLGTVSTASSNSVPLGSVISQSPTAPTVVNLGSAVNLVVSSGVQVTTGTPNPLTLQNNYFVTGDYVAAGVTLKGTGTGGIATGSINIPSSTAGGNQGVPDGADIIEAFLYWETVESTPTASGGNGKFDQFSITGQQIGTDQPNPDSSGNGTLRVYRADVNAYFAAQANGIRLASGTHSVSLPDSGGNGFPLTEGASLVVIYRVLSPNFPLKAVVIYDGSAVPTGSSTQVVQGFYDAIGVTAAGLGEITNLYAGAGWNTATSSVGLSPDASQYAVPLSSGSAYAAVIFSTPVNNSDNDGILNAWKAGPGQGDFHAGQPGYYDVKTGLWVPLPGAAHGQKDLFVQLDYMCTTVNSDGSCASGPNQENLFPSPDSNGNDPLAMVQQAFASNGVHLHLEIGNAIQEDPPCTDSGSQLCQFPGQSGVISWKNSLEFSKLWPRDLAACASGGDCTARFPYGQKDSYHYVLFGHSLAIPAWNTRYGTLTSINVVSGITTIVTADRGTGINQCPSRITISGVLSNPILNGVYNTSSCPDSKTIILPTPGVSNWTYSYATNTPPEPVIALTSGTITSISGYSDLGGSDSAVTLGLWLTAPNQDMSKRANVLAGTLFHEIGHTLGLSHGGLYYDSSNYVPTFEANCKPNYQSSMNYLFQLDGVGPNQAVAFSNQTLIPLDEDTAGSITQLTTTDIPGQPATYPTSAWYVPFVSGVSAGSAATLHCDGTPLTGPQASRVDASIAPITPAWSNGQDINFDGQDNTLMRGYNDWANIDLRQVGATGGEYASLASVLSFGSSTPQNIPAGGNQTLGSGGTVTLGSGGTVALSSGGTVTLGSGGTITLGSGGTVALGSGGTVTLGSGGTVTPGALGTVALGSGGTVTINGSGTITDGGTTTQVSSAGGVYSIGSGGIIALGSGGTVTLGSGGTVTLGSGGIVALGSGGTVALGSGGTVTLGSGGIVALGSGGTITLGSGGTVTLGSGGTVTLGSGGALSGSGGTIALGSGGTVTLGSGGTVTLGSGGTVALGSGGTVTLGSGGTVTLGSDGTVTLGSGGTVTLGSGGTFTPSGGGTPIAVGPGLQTFSSGGTITLGSGGIVALGSGGTVTLGSGGIVALGSGGTVTLGSGGTVTLGSGGIVALGSGGIVALGSGGTVALGSGGIVALGSGGTIALGSGGIVALGSGGTVTLGSGGSLTTELTYQTANSIVRPPSNPTETPTQAGVRIDWTAPAFGVVASYTIYRSSNGATPIVIGTVTGNPPATEFIDTNPDTMSATVVYTIATNLAPVPIDPTTRQSAPSTPAVLKNDQTITLGSLPSSALVSTQLAVTATAMSNGVANGLQVNFNTTGPCVITNQSIASGVSSATVTLNNTGSCTIIASQEGGTTYNAATSVSGSFPILPQSAAQAITLANVPPSAAFNSSFTVMATGGASGNPVTFTSSGVCTVSGATYTMTSSTGTCTVIANQAGTATYAPAPTVTQNVNATGPIVSVSPSNINFGTVNLGSITTKNITVSNVGTGPVTINQPILSIVKGGNSNEFVAVNLCPTPLAAGKSCTITIAFVAGPFYTPQSATLEIMDNAPGSPQPVTLGATVLIPQTITFTTNPPASAANKSSFPVAASGGGSGNAVTFTSSGACSITGTTPGTATYTMTSGTGTCSVIANQAGNSTYAAAAQVTKTVAATLTAQTITLTNVLASAAYKSSFTVTATGGGSGNAVKFTSSGACSNSGATYTMTSGTGTCSVIANQAGNSSYAAAAQVTKTVNASLVAQTITFTTNPPPSAAFNSSFTVTATGGASGNPVTFTSSGVCTVSGATYTMTSGTGTCTVIANQAGNSNYAAAAQVTKTVTATYSLASLSPTSLSFGTVSSGKSSSPKTATLSNTGTMPLIISSIGFTGANPSNFVQTNTCPSPSSSLAAGKSCTISVTFKSNGNGVSANLTVTDNTQVGTQTVSLSGN